MAKIMKKVEKSRKIFKDFNLFTDVEGRYLDIHGYYYSPEEVLKLCNWLGKALPWLKEKTSKEQ